MAASNRVSSVLRLQIAVLTPQCDEIKIKTQCTWIIVVQTASSHSSQWGKAGLERPENQHGFDMILIILTCDSHS